MLEDDKPIIKFVSPNGDCLIIEHLGQDFIWLLSL